MSLHYWFRNTSGTFEEITDRVRLPGADGSTLDVNTSAEEATIASSEIVIDDPDGDIIIGGLRRFYIIEDAVASSSNQIVWNGYTGERTIIRGPYKTDVGRQWRVGLVDHNTILERRVLTAASANRPAETDVQRMLWVEATAAGDLIDDTQWLSTANGVAMDAVDYRGQRVSDVINDCMQQSGKNAYLWLREEVTVDDGPGAISLWYDFAISSNYRSDARLSNVAAEVDLTTTFPLAADAELRRDPARVYSGVYLQYDGGTVYETLNSTAVAFARGGRDTTAIGENVKSAAKATARAQRYLQDFSSEEDVITTWVHDVPRASVNRFMAGMVIPVKATHWPGYETYQFMRILNRNVVEASEETYSIRLELGTGSGTIVSAAPTPTVLQATLTISTATANQAWASDAGASPVLLEVGSQYRIVASVIDCLDVGSGLTYAGGSCNLLGRRYDTINAPEVQLTLVGSSTKVVEPSYGWTPGDGTNTPLYLYDGIGWQYRGTPGSDYVCGSPPYALGNSYTGDWLTYDGPPVLADLSIKGTAISGFFGFNWTVNVRLEKR